MVAELVDELVRLLDNGRTTPGPKQENHGRIPFPKELLEKFPALAGSPAVTE
jgi:hypothetical protein